MPTEQHGQVLRDARPNEIPHGRPPKIVGNAPDQVRPREDAERAFAIVRRPLTRSTPRAAKILDPLAVVVPEDPRDDPASFFSIARVRSRCASSTVLSGGSTAKGNERLTARYITALGEPLSTNSRRRIHHAECTDAAHGESAARR
jgi:hypothetical protein